MPNNVDEGPDWQSVIGKCLAFLCLHVSEIKSETIPKKARFLIGLGLPKADAAGILNTTPASLNELFRLERNKKGGKSVAKGKKQKRTKRTSSK
jgi:hypothetical protein